VRARRAVSYLRLGLLKRWLPLKLLVGLDALLQPSGAIALLSPSAFVQLVVPPADGAPDGRGLTGEAIFCSPRSGAPLRREGDALVCDADGTRWRAEENFYDFKTPL